MITVPRRALPVLAGGAVLAGTALSALPARAEPDAHPARPADDLLRRMHAPGGEVAGGPVWSPAATGFASLPTSDVPEGAVGGLGGEIVVVRDAENLAEAAGREDPLVILVPASLVIEPFGSMIDVSSDTSILGVGRGGEIVGGGLRLDQVRNVVIRNLTFRDSYVPGDWDGKSPDNDNDGIRVDTSSHVWIDHNRFTRLGDGLVDVRKDSTNVTLSWNVFADHNKAVGVGWTDNVLTTITMHHSWFSGTYQRNGSIDNVAAGHLYNNLLEGQAHYGTMSRGASQLVVESSVYAYGEDAIVAKDPASEVDSRDNVFLEIRGRKDHTGATFEPSEHYDYAADPVEEVREIIERHAGPMDRGARAGRRIGVALDGSAEFASIGAAVGAAGQVQGPVEIVIQPGVYHEIVRIWPGNDRLTLRGATGQPEDVVLTYDLSAGTEKFYGGDFGATGAAVLGILADDVTLRHLTVENAYDEVANGPSQAQALRTVGDRVLLDGVRLLGNQDTFLADSPSKGVVSRVYVRGSFVEGDVDFVYGRGTVVLEDCEIHSVDRGQEVNGYVAAPATAQGTHGLLFTGCRFTSEAADGSVFLGRPWHPSSDPDVEPATIVRESWLGAHISTPAWSDMGGHPWEEDLLAEHVNTGPGAAPERETPGRPQLTEDEAVQHTRETYLGGADDWAPWG